MKMELVFLVFKNISGDSIGGEMSRKEAVALQYELKIALP